MVILHPAERIRDIKLTIIYNMKHYFFKTSLAAALLLHIVALLFVSDKTHAQTWDNPVALNPLNGTGGSFGLYTRMEVVNGNPAMVAYDASHQRVLYIRANDASGISWGTPVTVLKGGSGVLGIAVVNGNPAIVYSEGSVSLKYIRATDASGTSWGSPVTIETGSTTTPCLTTINGNPAISYWTSAGLKYVRATNADGTGWSSPIFADTTIQSGYFCSLITVNGYPAISYGVGPPSNTLKYVRATDANGTAWGTSLVLDNTLPSTPTTSMVVVNGNPAIAYSGSSGLKYIRAADASGSSWGSISTIVSGSGSIGTYATMAIVNGNPAISYYGGASVATMNYIRAANVVGSSWGSSVVTDTSAVGLYGSLMVVNGSPAVCYYESKYGDLKYNRATDAYGTGWGTPQSFDVSASSGLYGSVAVVAGNPALSYYSTNHGTLAYMRAANSTAANWGSPVTADSPNASGVGQYTSMTIVNGNPAISHYDVRSRILRYVRSVDATGSAWGTSIGFSTINQGQYTSLAVVNGYPAISFYALAGDLIYVRASDANGTAWGSQITLASAGNVGQYSCLRVVNGKPAVSYYDATNGDLKFIRATDADGTTWGAAVTPDATGAVGQYTSMAIVNGYPAIAYYDVTNGDLKFVRANDSNGTAWGTPITLASAAIVGQHLSMAIVKGYPAISYYDVTNGDLKYIRAVNANGSSWGTPVTLDANGNTGQYTSMAVNGDDVYIGYYDVTNLQALMIHGTAPSNEINITGNTTTIVDGDNTPSSTDHTDFGDVGMGNNLVHTFTIQNTGSADLTVSSIALSGTNAADYVIGDITLPAIVSANSSTTFTVTFTPGAAGTRTATVTVNNDDADEAVYDFAIQGTGLPPATALNFDGSNDYVSIGNPSNLQITGNLTLECKFRTTSSLGNYRTLVSKWHTGGWAGHGAYSLLWTSSGLIFIIQNTSVQDIVVSTNQNYNDGNWHQVAGTWDGTTARIYVDGVLVNSVVNSSFGSLENNSLGVYIGTDDWGVTGPGADRYFPGDIDEVRIWSRALCQGEIQNNMNCELGSSQTNLEAYYRLNNGFVGANNAGLTTATDLSGNGNNGTLVNFALSGSTSNWATGNVTDACTAFVPLSVSASSNSPVNQGSAINLSATASGTNAASATYSWTGPNSFSSTTQNPVVSNAQASNAGSYTVTASALGCTPANSSTTAVVNPAATALHFNGWGNTNPGGSNIDTSYDYVTVPDNNTMDLGNTYTIEAKVYLDDSTNNTIIDKGDYRYLFQTHPNGHTGLGLYNNNMGWIYSSGTVPTNQWVHIAVTFDVPNNKVTFYLNGNILSTHTGAVNGGADNLPINIGRQQPGSCVCNNFDGKMDELRVWNRVLCQGEIQNNMNCELNPGGQSGLAALYDFNQGYVGANNSSITTLTDASGNGNNGTLTSFALTGATSNWSTGTLSTACTAFTPLTVFAGSNSPVNAGSAINLTATTSGSGAGSATYAWTGPNSFSNSIQNPSVSNAQAVNAGTYNVTATANGCTATAGTVVVVNAAAGALNFDGNDDFISINNTLGNFGSGDFTIEMNIKTTAANQYILSKRGICGGDNFISINTGNGKPGIEIDNGIGGYVGLGGTISINDGNWHHFAVVRQSGKLMVFVDGVLSASANNANANLNNNYTLTLGNSVCAFLNGNTRFNGSMDEVRFWNRALCQGELIAHKSCEFTGAQTGLLAYYKFNQGFVNANNSSVTTLTDASGNGNNGTLSNFALTGAASNWVLGNLSGNCSAFIPPTANITAGGVTTFCQGGSVLLTANSGVGNTYQWQLNGVNISGATNSTYTASASGNYSVVVTNTGCSATSVATAVTVNPLPTPTITAGGPTTFCSGGSVNLSTGGISSLDFNGTNGYVTIPHSSGQVATQMTMEAWVYVRSTTAGGANILMKGNYGYGIHLGNDGCSPGNKLGYWVNAGCGSTILSTGTVPFNQWVHVAVVVTTSPSQTLTFYINGVNAGSSTSSSITINNGGNGPLILGMQGTGCSCNYFNGKMDEVRIWNTALTQAQIQANMNNSVSPSSANLQVYLRADNASGTTATDLSVNGTNGTLVNGMTWEVPSSSPIGGYASYLWNPGGATTASITANATGNYSVTVTDVNNCTGTSAAASVTVNPLPAAYNVSGGGSYCAGSAGLTIGLSNSETGVNYQLKNGASNVGSPIAGTGSAISFGNQTAAGTYTVVATNATTNCTSNMTGSATIIINSSPTVYNITGGGSACSNGSGVPVGLSGSQTGVNYQLMNGLSTVGSPVAGTGSAISFGNQTVAGTYTVIAAHTAAGNCTDNMNGSAVVIINPAPIVYNVTGGGSYCTGGAGVTIGLSGSETGVNYQLKNGASNVGSPVAGTGSAISFGNQTAAGIYTVVATNAATNCTSNMTGSATVNINSLPNVSISPSTAAICLPGGSAVLSASSSGGIQLNGTSQYGQVPHNSLLSFTSSGTIEAWVNLAPTSDDQDIVDKNVVGNDAPNYRFFVKTNGTVGYYSTTGASVTTSSISWNTWTHVAVVFNAGTVSFYFNGILKNTFTQSLGSANTGVLYIGRDWLGRWINGKMDEIRIWNVARTQAQIAANMNNEIPTSSSGLVAYYKFNEGTGSTILDATGVNNGTLFNSPTRITSTPVSSGAPVTYLWSTTATTSSINATAAGNYTVTVTDTNGCSATSAPATVTINPLPTITCPANITVNNAAGQCGATVTYPAATASAGTNTPTITYSIPSGSFFQTGTTQVKAYATDSCGNKDSCSFNVTVVDNTPPVLACGSGSSPNLMRSASTGGTASVVAIGSLNGASQYGSGLGSSCSDYWTPYGTLCDETPNTNSQTISTKTNTHSGATWNNVTNGIGVMVVDLGSVQTFNMAQLYQMFSDGKTTSFQGFYHSSTSSTPPAYNDPSWTSMFSETAVGAGVLSGNNVSSPTSVTFTPVTARYVRFYFKNNGTLGNGGYIEVRSVKLFNTNAGSNNIVATADSGQCTKNITYSISATDNCPGTIVTYNPASGSAFPIGTSTVNVLATDASGNTATCSFTVTINAPEINIKGNGNSIADGDNTPSATDNTDFGGVLPSVTVSKTYTIENNGTSNLVVSNINMSGTNASSFSVSGITLPATLAPNTTAAYTVTFNETAVGVKMATVNVITNDCDESIYDYAVQGEITCAPAVFTLCPTNISVSAAAGMCSQSVNYTSIVTGTPAPNVTYTFTGATTGSGTGDGSGTTFNVGVTTVAINAVNPCSNVNCTFTVTVTDNENPVIVAPANIAVNNDAGICGAVVSYTAPVGSDNCPGAATVQTAGLPSGSTFPVGTTTNTFVVTDAHGNTATASFTVIVTDNQAPVLSGVPANATVSCDNVPGPAIVTASDNCNTTLPVTYSQIITNGALPPTGLKGFWNFNENSGTTTADQTSFGNNGVLSSGVSWIPGQSGSAVQFPGTGNNYVQLPNTTNGALDTRYSISMFAWYWPGSNASQNNPIIQYNANGWGTHLWQTGSNQLFVRFTQRNTLSFTNNLAANTLIPNQWNCVGATYDYATGIAKLWCNGVNVQTLYIGQMELSTNYPVRVGSVDFDSRRTNSKVDNVAIYDRALDATEIAQLCAVTCPQSYTITRTWSATDASNNTTTASQTITVKDTIAPVLTVPANIVLNNATGICGAVANFQATATDNCSNNITITYSQNSGTIFPVGSTTVNVTAKDECGNTSTGNFTVTVTDNENPVIAAPANISANNDAGVCGALVTYTAPVGTDNCPGSTTIQTAGLASGSAFPVGTTTNTFVVTDAHGNTATASFTVTVTDNENPSITAPANISVNNDSGICGATVTYITPIGTDNCPGSTTVQTTGLASGSTFPVGTTTNTFVVTDAHGHTATASFDVVVTDNEKPAISIADVNVNADNGSCAATNVSLGIPATSDNCAIDSAWNNALTSYPVGTTTVTWNISDIHGNTNSTTQTVTVHDNQNPIVVTQPVTVYLDAIGTASITASDVNNGSSDNCGIQSLSVSPDTFGCINVGNNTVTLTVNDIHGNSANNTAVVTVIDTVKPVVVCPANITVSCLTLPSNTGTATATDACGISNITYTDVSTYSSNPANAAHYNYVISRTWTATDNHGNSSSCTQEITVQQLHLTADITNVSCYGTATGSIDLTVQGGVGNLSYSWSNGANTQDVSGLVLGTYSVTVTDSAGCTATATYNVTQPPLLTATTIIASPNPTVTGQAMNTIYLGYGPQSVTLSNTIAGGTTPYTYSWTPVTGVGTPSSVSTSVSPTITTTYTQLVTDAKGCTVSTDKTIYVEDVRSNNNKVKVCHNGNTISISANAVNSHLNHGDHLGTCFDIDGVVSKVSCYGGSNGSINITVYGSVAPYTYLWSNGATTEDVNGLTAGNYSVTVTSANGESTSASFAVTQYSRINIASNENNVRCYGDSSGSIYLNISGGNDPYTYLWNTGSTNKHRYGLPAGTYIVTVTDDNGCTMNDTTIITQPSAPIAITGTITNILCNGAETGAVDITVTGGTGPYNYDWDDDDNSSHSHHSCNHSYNNHWCNRHGSHCNSNQQDLNNVDAGTYTVVVTDANGCRKTMTFTITEPTPIAIAAAKINVSCYGGNDGGIDVTVTGGTAPYTYYWSNGGGTNEDRTSLSAGNYTLTVTDANGCTKTTTFSISQPTQLNANTVVTNVPCYGSVNGAVTLNVTGGSAPYTYSWSNGASTRNITGLLPGSYTVSITDTNGCSITRTATVSQPAQLVVTGTVTDVSCSGDDDGEIDITVSGGTAPYSYRWNNNMNCKDRSHLSAGSYNVTVTDANGCTTFASFTVAQPSAIAVTGVITNATCYGSSNGAITITATGGTSPYTYKWNNNLTVQNRTGLPAGSYSVTVKDANGCSKNASFNVTQPAQISGTVVMNPNPTVSGQAMNTIFRGYGPQSVTLTASAANGVSPYTYSWSPTTGLTNPSSVSTTAAPTTTTTYAVTITDANGCMRSVSKTILVEDVRNGDNIRICHDGHNITVAPSAVAAHLAHGDDLGYCESEHKGQSNDPQSSPNPGMSTVVIGDLKVFPNPTTGKFTIQLPDNVKGGEVIITDMLGKLVQKQRFMPDAQLVFDLHSVAKGVYTIQVQNGTTIYRALVTIQE